MGKHFEIFQPLTLPKFLFDGLYPELEMLAEHGSLDTD